MNILKEVLVYSQDQRSDFIQMYGIMKKYNFFDLDLDIAEWLSSGEISQYTVPEFFKAYYSKAVEALKLENKVFFFIIIFFYSTNFIN